MVSLYTSCLIFSSSQLITILNGITVHTHLPYLSLSSSQLITILYGITVHTHIPYPLLLPIPNLLYGAKHPSVIMYSFLNSPSVSIRQHTPPTTTSLKYAVNMKLYVCMHDKKY